MYGIFIFVLTIICLTVVLPLYLVLRFITQWRSQRVINHEEEGDINELWKLCDHLEKRVHNMERLLHPHGSSPDQSA